MGPIDYSALAKMLMGGMARPVADDPMSRRDAVNPIMGLEGAGGPRAGGGGGRGPFITEMRGNRSIDYAPGSAQITGKDGKPLKELSRYGVWQFDPARGKYQVIESSNDLNALFKSYGRIPVIPEK